MGTYENGRCPIWGTDCKVLPTSDMSQLVDSPRAGGKYLIGYEVDKQLKLSLIHIENDQRVLLTAWIVAQHQEGVELPRLTQDIIERVGEQQPLRPYEKSDLMLLRLTSKWKIGQTINRLKIVHDPAVLAVTQCVSEEEADLLLQYLHDSEYIRYNKDFVRVMVPGYQRIAEIENLTDSRQGFIAMWFDDSLDDLRDTMKSAIADVGFVPFIVNQMEFSEKICDKIEVEIRRSRFIVADFTYGDTGVRGSVYYEAGLAMGIGIPVVWTCREDLLHEVHFDTRQYNHIGWDKNDLAGFKDRLVDRIRVLLKLS